MKLVFVLIVVTLLISCSNPVKPVECATIGAIDNIGIDFINNGITVHNFKSVATSGDIYFYLDEKSVVFNRQLIIPIPDSTLLVDSYPFVNLSVFIAQDALGRWYMQIIRNGSNLCMSVGGTIEIKSFTVRW